MKILFLVPVALAVAGTAGKAQLLSFNAPTALSIGGTGLATGDFNGDGKLDLVTTGGSFVTVYLGNGNGSFQAPVSYLLAFNNAAQGVVTADFNGDGKLDLAVASGHYVWILPGNGDGTFQTAASYATGLKDGIQVAAGDFNGDGALDIVVAAAFGGLAVLLGNGNGSFGAPTTLSGGTCSGGFSDYLAVADFNGDGNLDLAATNCSGIAIYLGNGKGGFGPPTEIGTVAETALAAGDFNGDGKLDLAAINLHQVSISVYLGKGDGTFQSPSTYPDTLPASALAAADLNGDGKLDLVTDSGTILLGQGD